MVGRLLVAVVKLTLFAWLCVGSYGGWQRLLDEGDPTDLGRHEARTPLAQQEGPPDQQEPPPGQQEATLELYDLDLPEAVVGLSPEPGEPTSLHYVGVAIRLQFATMEDQWLAERLEVPLKSRVLFYFAGKRASELEGVEGVVEAWALRQRMVAEWEQWQAAGAQGSGPSEAEFRRRLERYEIPVSEAYEATRQELLDALNADVFGEPLIANILFTEFRVR